MNAAPAYTPGRFVWHELFTADVPTAKHFYATLFGWTWEDRPLGPEGTYTLWKNGNQEIAGMMNLADLPVQAEPVAPHWALYVSVEDVDAAAERAVRAGGRILGDFHTIPGVGRFSVVQDPQGAMLTVFRSSHGDPADAAPGPHDFCWANLSTHDPAGAAAFYQHVIGWGASVMPGSQGQTTLFSRSRMSEPDAIASLGPAPAGSPSAWTPFVSVEALSEAIATCQALGGTVYVARMDIPEVGAFGVIEDPTGAMIFLLEPLRG